MIFNYDKNREVVALLGAGSMGLSIVERIASNRIVLLGDISEKALAAAKEKLEYSGYAVETMQVDASDKASIYAFARKAAELGPVMYFINTAGASPHQTNPQHIIDLDLVGSAHALDAFGGSRTRCFRQRDGTRWCRNTYQQHDWLYASRAVDGGMIAAIKTGNYNMQLS